MTPSRTALLQRMPIFGALAPETLEFLVGRTRTAQIEAGAWFFREGDAANQMFVLEAGRVEVVRTRQGRQLRLCELASGDCFGEMALLDLWPRSASVRALEPCRAIEIAAADLFALFERDPVQFALIQMNLAREMSRRLRAAGEQLFRLWVGAEDAAATPPDFRSA
jgi:CRP/FNR family cyclic AMP-dependent transcriptional regulator